jgi:GTPase SAR1 family protein
LSEIKRIEKLLDDEPDPKSELFNFPKLSSDLEKVLLSSDTITPYSIVIHGEWGSGKTSLARRVYESLKIKGTMPDGTELKVIWFDAWQYEKLDPVAALLQIIAKAYPLSKARVFKKAAAGVGLGFLDLTLRSVTANMSSLKNIDEIMTRFLDSQVEDIKTIAEKLGELVRNERLLIFIDDLDRCSIENALEMLEAIKLFLNVKGIISLMMVDIRKLERAWELRYRNGSTITSEGKQHLDKIFQLRLAMPQKTTEEMERYLDSLTTTLHENERVLVKTGFPRNPRKVKRILNIVYFLSLEADEESQQRLFPMFIIWAVISLEYPELAALIKTNWITLIQLCLYSYHIDQYENLKLLLPKIKRVIPDQTNIHLNKLPITYRHLLATTVEGFELIIGKPDLFEFLRAVAIFFGMRVNNDDDRFLEDTLQKIYDKEGILLKETLGFAGLIP